eukprot:UN14611
MTIIGMLIFKSAEFNNEIDFQGNALELFGISICIFRGFMKALDFVYIEWFLHNLDDLTFNEKQISVSFWLVISSFIPVIIDTRFLPKICFGT